MGSFSGSNEGPDGVSGPSFEYSLRRGRRLVLWGTSLDLQRKVQPKGRSGQLAFDPGSTGRERFADRVGVLIRSDVDDGDRSRPSSRNLDGGGDG